MTQKTNKINNDASQKCNQFAHNDLFVFFFTFVQFCPCDNGSSIQTVKSNLFHLPFSNSAEDLFDIVTLHVDVISLVNQLQSVSDSICDIYMHSITLNQYCMVETIYIGKKKKKAT